MTTNQIFHNRNRNLDLLSRLMESEEPVECDSFSDLNEDIINYTLKDFGYETN